jgi:hypothetical protein
MADGGEVPGEAMPLSLDRVPVNIRSLIQTETVSCDLLSGGMQTGLDHLGRLQVVAIDAGTRYKRPCPSD